MPTKSITVTGLQQALDDLTVFQRARIPGSVLWTLSEFGKILRENEQQVIRSTFNRANNFTVNAPLYKKPTKENPRLLFFLRDIAAGGISPDRYLAPQVDGGEVYVTKFSRALRRAGAIAPSEYVFHWGNDKYKPTPSFISALTSVLGRNSGPVKSGRQYARNLRSTQRYFILDKRDMSGPKNAVNSRRRYSDNGYDGPGIYTRKGKKLDLVYRILKNVPIVPPKYDWTEERMSKLADQYVPDLLLNKLAEF
jgi:hypothetical protein